MEAKSSSQDFCWSSRFQGNPAVRARYGDPSTAVLLRCSRSRILAQDDKSENSRLRLLDSLMNRHPRPAIIAGWSARGSAPAQSHDELRTKVDACRRLPRTTLR